MDENYDYILHINEYDHVINDKGHNAIKIFITTRIIIYNSIHEKRNWFSYVNKKVCVAAKSHCKIWIFKNMAVSIYVSVYIYLFNYETDVAATVSKVLITRKWHTSKKMQFLVVYCKC